MVMSQAPAAAGQHLIALDFDLSDPHEIVAVAGNDEADLDRAIEAVYDRYLPNKVVVPGRSGLPETLSRLVPLLADRSAIDGEVTTYICKRFTCQQPEVGLQSLKAALETLSNGRNA